MKRIKLINTNNGIRFFDNGNWIDISSLPVHIGGKNNGNIKWDETKNCCVKFKYKNLIDEITIINYNSSQILTVQYKDNPEEVISRSNFLNCSLSRILKDAHIEFIFNIDDEIHRGDMLNIIITDRKYTKYKSKYNGKYYKYKCLLCGFESGKNYDVKGNLNEELWISENKLINNYQCACCSPQPEIVVTGINSMSKTSPWMNDFLKDKNEAFKNLDSSSNKLLWKCRFCGEEKTSSAKTIKARGFTCKCMHKGGSFPERYVRSVLSQLDVNFKTEKTFNWSKKVLVKNNKLCGLKKYDFYIPELNTIIEVHGDQHITGSFQFKNHKARSHQEEIENDTIKRNLAKTNNITHYIEINCPDSSPNIIKKNVLNSKLSSLYDLTVVDWNKCVADACNNIVKQACDFWEINKYGTQRICEELKLTRECIANYLRIGATVDWCDYSTEMSHIRSIIYRYKTVYCVDMDKLYLNTKELTEWLYINKEFNLKESTVKEYINNNKAICGMNFVYLKSLTPNEKNRYNLPVNRVDEFMLQKIDVFELKYKLSNEYMFIA